MARPAAPLAGTLVYDGQCGFCRRCVSAARRRLRSLPEFVPFQTADLAALGLTRAQAESSVRFVPAAGPAVGGHEAVAAVLRGQPGAGWRLLAAAMSAPPGSWVAARAYRWVSRHRGSLPGRCRSCGG